MSPRLRHRWANAMLLAASLALCGLLMLAALPFIAPAPEPAIGAIDYGELVAYDPDRPGGHLRPDIDVAAQGEQSRQTVRWRTDRHGFRVDHQVSEVPAEGVERILLLGDSYIDGMRTDQSATIGALLEKGLQASGRDVEVLISGHNNPANAWYWLQTHAPRFHPRRVLLGITLGNDLVFLNYGAGIQPGEAPGEVVLAERAWVDGRPDVPPGLLPADAFLPERPLADAWNAREFALRDWLARRSDWFADLVPPATGPFEQAPRQVHDRDFFTSINLFFTPPTPFTEACFQRSEAVLAGIAALLARQDVAFEVLLLPTRFQVDKRDWRLLKRRLALDGQRYDLRAPNTRLLAACAAHGIRCHDPTEAMAEHVRSTGTRLYRRRGDMHLNEAGNAFVADWLRARWGEEDKARGL